MADVGYFDGVSANLKTSVGAQVKGVAEGRSPTPRPACLCPSTPSTRASRRPAALGGLAEG